MPNDIFGAKTNMQKLAKKMIERTLNGVERLETATSSFSGFSPAPNKIRMPQTVQNVVQALSGVSLRPIDAASPESDAARVNAPNASIDQPAATVCSLVAVDAIVQKKPDTMNELNPMARHMYCAEMRSSGRRRRSSSMRVQRGKAKHIGNW